MPHRRKSQERWIHKQKSEGKCISCSKPAREGKCYCQACADKKSISQKIWFQNRKTKFLNKVVLTESKVDS